MSVREEANAIYDKYYSELDLPEKRLAALKDVIFGALKEGRPPRKAVRRWADKKGIDLGGGDDASSVPAVKEGGFDTSKLDRKSVKATIATLRDAGVRIKYDKEESTDQLAVKLSQALNGLPSPEMMEKLERIDPVKLKVLNGDGACLGIFIDMTQPECQVCTDRDECVKKYISNLNGNLKMFKEAMVDMKTEAAAKNVTEEEAEAVAKKSNKGKKKGRLKYDPKMSVYVMEIENPVNKKKEPDAHEMVESILKEVPTSLGELRKTISKHFEYETTKSGNRDFMEEIFLHLRNYGIIKLWEELSKDQQKAYKKAMSASSSEDEDEGSSDEDDDEEDDEDEDE